MNPNEAPHFSEKTKILKLEEGLQSASFFFVFISAFLMVSLLYIKHTSVGLHFESTSDLVLAAAAITSFLASLFLFSAIQNRSNWLSLERNSGLDPVSGTLSRQNFEKMLEEELRRGGRYHYPISLCYLDIDQFSAFNEEFGKPEGDDCLKEFGALLRHTTRFADCVCRYQGDEYCILLPHTDLVRAEKFMSRLSQISEEKMQLFFSAGVTSYQAGEGKAAFLMRAFSALSQAKREGLRKVRYLASEQIPAAL